MIDPAQYPTLIELINETYLDQVEQIVGAKTEDNGDILCIARDGPKQLAIKITPTDISIRLLNPQAVAGNNPLALSDPLPSPSTVDRFLTQLQRQAQPQIAGMVSQLQELFDSSTDLVEFREKLDTAYPDLDGQDLTQIMAQAMFASKLAGVFEAEQDAD